MLSPRVSFQQVLIRFEINPIIPAHRGTLTALPRRFGRHLAKLLHGLRLSGVPLVDSGKVVRLLKHWNRVSRTDLAPSLFFETLAINLTQQLVVGSARCAVRAA